jgi:hypothetical protein
MVPMDVTCICMNIAKTDSFEEWKTCVRPSMNEKMIEPDLSRSDRKTKE